MSVPGRTSCFAFKGRNEEGIFHEVGERLHASAKPIQRGTPCARIPLFRNSARKNRTETLGDRAHTIDELERAYDDSGFYISLINVDPLFDDLRGDPRFEAIVQKVVGSK